jgi:hypothetical protein
LRAKELGVKVLINNTERPVEQTSTISRTDEQGTAEPGIVKEKTEKCKKKGELVKW